MPSVPSQTTFADAANIPKVLAVSSNQSYFPDELTLQAAYLPLDSFNRYITLGASYTHYYSAFIGWEVLNVNDAFDWSSGLSSDLASAFGVTTEKFDTLNYYGTTNLIYTPFYTKNLFMNSSILNGETSFLAGGGLSKFDSGFVDCADLGVIFKYHIGESTALKFDFRYIFYFSTDERDNFTMSVGFTYNLGSKVEKHVDEEADE